MVPFLFACGILFLKAYPVHLASAYCNTAREGIHSARLPHNLLCMSCMPWVAPAQDLTEPAAVRSMLRICIIQSPEAAFSSVQTRRYVT
jgi:hypothetical protein